MSPRRWRFKHEVDSPLEDRLYDSYFDLFKTHSTFGRCKHSHHSSALVQVLNVFTTARYEGVRKLEYLKLHEKELQPLLSLVEEDAVDADSDSQAELAMVAAQHSFREALRSLEVLTQTQLLMQLHFKSLARSVEGYEQSRLFGLSRARLSFLERPTAEMLERYLVQAEKLEDQGLALVNEFTLVGLRRVGLVKAKPIWDEKSPRDRQRELLDELWVHSMMGYVPRRTTTQTFRAALDAKKPHAGVHIQQPHGVVRRRGL